VNQEAVAKAARAGNVVVVVVVIVSGNRARNARKVMS
jgi:hypothetical protein